MANKERQKRSARQARARERENIEAAQAASASSSSNKGAAKAVAKATPTKEEIAKKESSLFGRIRRYVNDVRIEMHRVTWPSRTETINYSITTVLILIIYGVIVWAVDTGIVAALVGITGLRG